MVLALESTLWVCMKSIGEELYKAWLDE
jgi:hypothetical protein